MTDKTEQAIFMGEWAQRLLNDELLNDAFATIEQEYTQQWLDSPERDIEGRERLRLTIKCLHRLKLELESVLDQGKTAAHELSLAQRIGQKFAKFS